MSWLRVAFGLIREAAGTETGQEVLSSVLSQGRRNPSSGSGSEQVQMDIGTTLAEHRAQIDNNLETMVRMLNAQNEKLTLTIRRQRIWNMALAAGLAVAFLIALLH